MFYNINSEAKMHYVDDVMPQSSVAILVSEILDLVSPKGFGMT